MIHREISMGDLHKEFLQVINIETSVGDPKKKNL